MKRYLQFGEPPLDDVEAAARLWIKYEDADAVTPELGQMFHMSVNDPAAVMARVKEIRSETA